MAEIHPNDIGLATFADVGDVSGLKTKAKTLVGAVNELCGEEYGANKIIGVQLYIDGENNVIIGENNVVHGNDNLIIGSNNVINGSGHNLIQSGKNIYAAFDISFESIDLDTGRIYYYMYSGDSQQLPFAAGDKVALTVYISWTNSDYTDYISVETERKIYEIQEVNTSGNYITFTDFDISPEPPDDIHTKLDYYYVSTLIPLNESYILDNALKNAVCMGNSATGSKSVTVNNGTASGYSSFAANSGSASGSSSAAFNLGKSEGTYSFAANSSMAKMERSAAFNSAYCYAPYSFAAGYYSRVFGRALKCESLDTTAKKLTLESGQNVSSITGKKIFIRCYNTNNTFLLREATIASVSGNVLTLTDVSFISGSYAEKLLPDKLAYVADTSTTYGTSNFAGGYYSVAASKYSLGYGRYVSASHENSVIFGKYGVTDSANSLALANGTSVQSQGLAFKVLSSGAVHADAAYTTPCADYAEFFEWADGNPDGEDRAGYFVKLNGDKIVKCGGFDTPLGVVSAAPAIIGDSGELHWHGKFATDDFGRVQYHDVTVPAERDEDGNIIAEEHIERQPVLNPEWDNTTEYVPRKDRKEWAAVGVLGKLVVYDDGTLQSGDLCRCGENGTAVKSVKNGYPVLKRISDDKVLIWLK